MALCERHEAEKKAFDEACPICRNESQIRRNVCVGLAFALLSLLFLVTFRDSFRKLLPPTEKPFEEDNRPLNAKPVPKLRR